MLTTFVPADGDDDGFDDDVFPPWVMLKDDERRLFLLNGSTMHLHSVNPGVATAKFASADETTSSRRQVIVEAVGSGRTVIEARLYGHVKAVLKVSSFPERLAHVNFYRVEDENGDVPIFNSSMVPHIIAALNKVYLDQANLHFTSHLVREFVRIPAELVTRDPSRKNRRTIFNALREKARELDPATNHYHVFWCKEYGAFDFSTPCNCNVLGEADDVPAHVCIVEDVDSRFEQSQIVAHELGHCLGATHDKEHQGALMYPSTDRHGRNRKLYKKTVEEIRGEA